MTENEVNGLDYYENMKRHGITLPPPPPKGGIYAPMVRFAGNCYYTSGTGCKRDGAFLYTGQLGVDVTLEQAQEAACQCVLNILSNIQAELGDLNRIRQIVKILGFVSSTEGCGQQPQVLNAASQLLIDVFGEPAGCCARSAIGTNVLPGNQSVEIEMMFEVN